MTWNIKDEVMKELEFTKNGGVNLLLSCKNKNILEKNCNYNKKLPINKNLV